MIGQVVIHRLAEQYTLGAIAVEHSPDEVDLQAFALFADGHVGVVEIPHVHRGTGVDQWQETPTWPPEPDTITVEVQAPTPTLAAARADLMPRAQLPSLPTMPLMIIIRHD